MNPQSQVLWIMRRFIFFIGLICFAAALRAEVVLEVYWSLKCPHCLEALPQIEAMAKENPWLRVESLEITRSLDNLQRFVARAEALGGTAQAVPTLIYCGQMAVGWDDSAAGLESLIGRLRACESGEPASGGTAEPSRVALPLLGEVDPAVLSLPVLTVLLAGLDAFNPCAFFVLLFLLSLLAHQHQRRRMLLIGGVFVSVSGLMYFAFMAAAKVIAFDLFFEKPGSADAELLAAIRRARERGSQVFVGVRQLLAGRPALTGGLGETASGAGLLCIGGRIAYASIAPLAVVKIAATAGRSGSGTLGDNGRFPALGPPAAGAATLAIDQGLQQLTIVTHRGRTLWQGPLQHLRPQVESSGELTKDCPLVSAGDRVAEAMIRLAPLVAWRDPSRRHDFEEARTWAGVT